RLRDRPERLAAVDGAHCPVRGGVYTAPAGDAADTVPGVARAGSLALVAGRPAARAPRPGPPTQSDPAAAGAAGDTGATWVLALAADRCWAGGGGVRTDPGARAWAESAVQRDRLDQRRPGRLSLRPPEQDRRRLHLRPPGEADPRSRPAPDPQPDL